MNAKRIGLAMCLLSFIALLDSQPALAKVPAASPSTTVTLPYNSKHISDLTLHYNFQSFIEFSIGEKIQTISVVDPNLWQVTPANNRLFIRPLSKDAVSTLTVITNMRTYLFSLSSEVYKGKRGQALVSAVRFSYP